VSCDLGPEELVYGQAAGGGDQPAVAELSLDQVVTVDAVDEQARILADLLHARTHARAHTSIQWRGDGVGMMGTVPEFQANFKKNSFPLQ